MVVRFYHEPEEQDFDPYHSDNFPSLSNALVLSVPGNNEEILMHIRTSELSFNRLDHAQGKPGEAELQAEEWAGVTGRGGTTLMMGVKIVMLMVFEVVVMVI
ncbi:hypothetical protein E2C01_100926 [Portunus trituberculatus]|uniref:Uncharacterized protein n=1 Tax=Portunus trituberculatus TaxID=210409 RepID=A0A5B7KKQ3_PORTR|nr:hypothetical protein [Portunus trituberculatus]